MVWEVKKTKKLLIGGEEIDVSGMTATEVKDLILRKARERGWARIKVYIDGREVTPEEFMELFDGATTIEVYKADVAG